MILTEEEITGKCIPEDRLFDILRASDVVITKLNSDRNAKGHFLFIRAKLESCPEFFMPCATCGRLHVGPYPGLSFFGMGFDEREHRFYENEWRFHGATHHVIDTGASIPFESVQQEIEKKRPS